MKKTAFFYFFLLFFALFIPSIFSQEDQQASPDVPEDVPACVLIDASIDEPAFDQDSVFVINSFGFNITGRTRPFVIIHRLGLREGEKIHGLENLEIFIANNIQLLVNERVFQRVSLYYNIGPADEGGKFPVDLLFDLEDSWNFIVVPNPRYSSSEGFRLTLNSRDYNFLGTMNPLRLDARYEHDIEGRNSFWFRMNSDVPFQALGLHWEFLFDNVFEYRLYSEEPFHFMNSTGFSVELPFGNTIFTMGFLQSFILNDENSYREREQYGFFQSGFYMSSNPFVSWEIPTGIEIGNFGMLTYTPRLSAVFNYGFSRWPLKDNRKGPFLNFSQTLGFDRVDWIGNFRRGFDVYFFNSFSYDFHRMRQNQNALGAYYSFSAAGHFILNNFTGLSTRLKFRHWFYRNYSYNDQAGNVLRGILNRSLRAQYMLSLNLDMPIRVLYFSPSTWFNSRRLRFFDFELHLSPIMDFAMFRDPVNNIAFDIRNTIFCYGLELMFFPSMMRSVYIRLSFATNTTRHIRTSPGANEYEIFFGLRHHF